MQKIILLSLIFSTSGIVCAQSSDFSQLFFEAVRKNDVEKLQEYKKNNENLAMRDAHGNNGLHIAAECGHKEVIEVLTKPEKRTLLYRICYGWLFDYPLPAVNIRNDEGETPLFCAVKHGHQDVLDALIAGREASQAIPNKHNMIPMTLAVKDGKLAMATMLINADERVLERLSDDKNWLTWSIEYKQSPMIELFAAYKNLREKCDAHGMTPMHHCVVNQHKEGIDILRKHGCPVDIPDASGKTPLNYAYNFGDPQALVEMSSHLIKLGANPNAKDNEGKTQLHRDIHDPELVRNLLLKDRVNPNEQDNNGDTPFHMAMRGGHKESVQFLLEVQANMKKCNKEGLTPFAQAIDVGNFELADMAASLSNINTIDTKKRSIAVRAIARNDISALKYALDKGIDVSLADENKNTAIHWAASNDNSEPLLHILGCGITTDTLNEVNENGSTAVFIAAVKGYEKNLALLLQQGPDVRIKNKKNSTAFLRVCESGFAGCAQQLVAYDPDCAGEITATGDSGLSIALSNEKYEVIPFALHKKVMNVKNNDGNAPMHTAVKKGLGHSSLEAFLAEGADPLLLDDKGNSCLNLAIAHGNNDAKYMFVEYKDLINRLAYDGYAAIHQSVNNNDVEFTKTLLEKGADCNVRDHHGMPPLSHAAQNGDAITLELLINYGARVNAKDGQGLTAIARATRKGSLDCVQLLNRKHADIHGQELMHQAADYGHKHLIEYYKSCGLSFNEKDRNGKTPFMRAVVCDQRQVTEAYYDESYIHNGDINMLLSEARHNGTESFNTSIQFLKKKVHKWRQECALLKEKRDETFTLSRNVTVVHNRLTEQAVKEYALFTHPYTPSACATIKPYSNEQIDRLTPQQRAEYMDWLDTCKGYEVKQSQEILQRLEYISKLRQQREQEEQERLLEVQRQQQQNQQNKHNSSTTTTTAQQPAQTTSAQLDSESGKQGPGAPVQEDVEEKQGECYFCMQAQGEIHEKTQEVVQLRRLPCAGCKQRAQNCPMRLCTSCQKAEGIIPGTSCPQCREPMQDFAAF